MFVYAQFNGKWAECYEFGEVAFSRIASGDLDPLYEAGITNFNRVTVEDQSGYREIWTKRQTRNQNSNQ